MAAAPPPLPIPERNEEKRRWVRATVAICAGVFLVLFPPCRADVATLGAMQLAVDAANYRLVRFISALPQDSVVSVNMPNPNEYVTEIAMHLTETEGRPDIVLDFLDTGSGVGSAGPAGGYVATPKMRSQVVPGVRIALHEGDASRLQQGLLRVIGDGREPVFRYRRHVQLMMSNLHQPVCSLLLRSGRLYCRWPAPFIDTRVLSYGWSVYRR